VASLEISWKSVEVVAGSEIRSIRPRVEENRHPAEGGEADDD
jgi:hypothetical protein